MILSNLGMATGKLASQAGHAFTEAILASQEFSPNRFHEYRAQGLGTKVVLQTDSLDALRNIHQQCQAANIPARMITDSGCTNFFDGQPTITALGVGPAKRHEVKKILGKLKLA